MTCFFFLVQILHSKSTSAESDIKAYSCSESGPSFAPSFRSRLSEVSLTRARLPEWLP